MYPALFQKAVSTISDMSKANYFYIIAYPEYDGFRIEHDPMFTAYIAVQPTSSAVSGGLVILLLIAVVIAVAVAVFALRKKPRAAPQMG
jgi:hypothetical protein